MMATFVTGLLCGLVVWQAIGIVARLPGLTAFGGRRGWAWACLGIAFIALGAVSVMGAWQLGGWELIPGFLLGFPCQLALASFTALAPADGFNATSGSVDDTGHVRDVGVPVRLPESFPKASGVVRPASFSHEFGARSLTDGDEAISMPATLFLPRHPPSAAVLLICGAGDTRQSFKGPFVRALVARGLGVLSIDPPGHGEFQTVPATLANLQAGASAAFAWLTAQFPDVRIGVAGISLGGCQAAWLAAAVPELAAVALISTPISLPPVRRWTYLLEALALGLPGNWAALRFGSVCELWRAWKSMRGYVPGADSLYTVIDRFGLIDQALALRGRPVLVVHGLCDAAVPYANARVLAAASGGMLFPVWMATHLSVIVLPDIADRIAAWLEASLSAPKTRPGPQ